MTIIIYLQLLVSIALIAAVILQHSGSGLGSALGGGNTYHTKRGVEKSLFILTIILAVCFTLLSLTALIIQ